MKNLKYQLIGLWVLISFCSFGQELAGFKQQIEVAKETKTEFYQVSDLLLMSGSTPKIANAPKNAQYFDYNSATAKTLFAADSKVTEYVSLKISAPTGGNDWTLDLVEVPSSFYTYLVTTSSGKGYQGSKTKQRHYRGVVRGREKESLVSISMYEKELMGIVSIHKEGNYNLGKLENSTTHLIYRDLDLETKPKFSCATSSKSGAKYKPKVLRNNTKNFMVNTECLDIYLETEEDIFQDLGSVADVESYILGLFNQVATIYANERITMRVSELRIWDSPETYDGDLECNGNNYVLTDFQDATNAINGDLGQLLTFRLGGGVAAGFNGLCNPDINQRLSVAGIDNTFSNIPTYSWSVYVMTHELGHLLGSRHTHACVWNGNNTAIDGCGECQEPAIINDLCDNITCDNCVRPASPADGGTIMSYCHQDDVGINFQLGFGQQPGDVIRNSVANAACVDLCEVCSANSLLITQAVIAQQVSDEQVNDLIIASNQVLPGGEINYYAGNSVTLINGFHAQQGSAAYIAIAPCNLNPVVVVQRKTQSNIKVGTRTNHTQTLHLYPNPTKGTFTIVIPTNLSGISPENQRIGIFNLSGTQVMNMEVNAGEQIKVNLSGNPKGIYLVKYFSGNQVIVKKVVYN
ncbi:hypothetical protein BKI52_27880 [marine bacterium AO1-C]|nr:hypothetical protein BKI52_27880 [marine bacterium AO1-C]